VEEASGFFLATFHPSIFPLTPVLHDCIEVSGTFCNSVVANVGNWELMTRDIHIEERHGVTPHLFWDSESEKTRAQAV